LPGLALNRRTGGIIIDVIGVPLICKHPTVIHKSRYAQGMFAADCYRAALRLIRDIRLLGVCRSRRTLNAQFPVARFGGQIVRFIAAHKVGRDNLTVTDKITRHPFFYRFRCVGYRLFNLIGLINKFIAGNKRERAVNYKLKIVGVRNFNYHADYRRGGTALYQSRLIRRRPCGYRNSLARIIIDCYFMYPVPADIFPDNTLSF